MRWFFILTLLLCSTGCGKSEADSLNIPVMKPSIKMIVVDPRSDNMDRGNHELTEHVVVDPDFYKNIPIKLGDIVYFDGRGINNINEKSTSRVIALAGQKISIEHSQIYVDGIKLNETYGLAHIRGRNKTEFDQQADAKTYRNKTQFINEVFDFNLEELIIPPGHIYVIGDDWSRSRDSRLFGPIDESLIIGKVVGICEKCPSKSLKKDGG